MKRTVLVVEDNPGVRECICQGLTDAGYIVEAVDTGSAAVLRMGATAYAAVLMDLSLPDINGAEVAEQARGAGCVAPIIAVTGVLPLIPTELLAAAGFVAWIKKPMRISALVETVNQWVERAAPPA